MRHRPSALCSQFSVLCLLSSGLGLTGCGKRETPVEEGLRTRTLLVGNGAEPGDLDPHLASVLSDQVVVNILCLPGRRNNRHRFVICTADLRQ